MRSEKIEGGLRPRRRGAISLFSLLLSHFFLFAFLGAAGCAGWNPWAQQEQARQTQLAAARANAAADRAEASAAAAEKAAREANITADRVGAVVRADSKAIDADVARINYLIARRERRRRKRRRHHAPPANAASPNPAPKKESTPPYGTE
jgi:hypothetical protein